jgi:hypothetical protein
MNSTVTVRNPLLEPAVHMHDVAEAGDAQQARAELTVRRRLAVHEDGLVLVRQELGELLLDRLERGADRTGQVSMSAAEVVRRTDVEDHDLP